MEDIIYFDGFCLVSASVSALECTGRLYSLLPMHSFSMIHKASSSPLF
jgi:hypothetical protein